MARGAGGTPGGILEFVIGVALASAGAYLLTSRVMVTTGFWNFWGQNSFGLTLIPLMVGIGIVFFNGRSFLGWMLVIVGSVIILAGIIANMNIYFQPTSLFNTVMMLALLAGGLGLVAKSVRAH
ncbi:MAG: hypothetical protein KY467_08285 [Gemmatimonadetes bacterium]|nr:hypothetical protein [Gemmatimonadota bacterium]